MASEEDGMGTRPYIKEILLQDFMCHHNFEIKLGNRLNLIYGTNGSGKSTILTAIMVALGSKAKATSRSENLGGLVRTGCSNCWITIKFYVPTQVGEMYMKYGPEVTVTRRINSKGSSQYTIKSSDGRNIPKAGTQDVRDLCFHFGIYPENEMAMLSQEKAKEFLVHATNRMKYDKLQRALQQQLIRANMEAVVSLDGVQKRQVEEMKLREENAKLAEERAEEILARASLQNIRRQKLFQIKKILRWHELDEPTAAHHAQSEILQMREAELATLESHHTETQNILALEEQESRLVDEVNMLGNTSKAADSAVADIETDIQNQEYNITRMKEDIQSIEIDIADSEKELREFENKLAQHGPEALERNVKELKAERDSTTQRKLESELAQAEIDQKIVEIKERVSTQRRAFKSIEEEYLEHQSTLRSLHKEIQDLESGRSSSGRRAPAEFKLKELERLVNATSDWVEKPVGPLYDTIELDDEGANYSPALERLWNTTLDSWWVKHDADRKLLMRLAKMARLDNLRIILRKDDAFRFDDALPKESKTYNRVVDLLQVKSEAIKRILVDLNGIESMVLVKSVETAFEAISDSKIKNSLAVTKTKRGTTEFTLVSVSGSRRDSSRVHPFGFTRMKIGSKARQTQVEAEIRELESTSASLKARRDAQSKVQEDLERELDQEQRNAAKQKNIARRCDDEIETLSRKIVSLETDVGAQNYTYDIERIKPLIERKRREVADFRDALEAYKEELERLRSLRAERVQVSEEQYRAFEARKIDLRDLNKTIRRAKDDRAQIESRLHRLQDHVIRSRLEVEVLERDLQDLSEDILNEVGPLLPSDEDENFNKLRAMPTKELRHELELLQSEAEVAAATDEELERARRDLADATKTREHAKTDRIEMERYCEGIRNGHKRRLENEQDAWNKLKHRIGTSFSKFLKERNFSGHVIINDDKKTLQVEAAPEASSKRNVATLSGGEKSFTQVALLMSIWRAMSVGLVAMDEYDVFMDKINRSSSLLLLAKTVYKGGMQCLIITPQDVDTSVLNQSNISYKLHKLSPINR